MTLSLTDELNARAVDTDGVHQALRYYLAERLDDLSPENMLEAMYEAAGRDRVDAARADLARDPQLLDGAALVVLPAAWAEESERDRVRAVLAETKDTAHRAMRATTTILVGVVSRHTPISTAWAS